MRDGARAVPDRVLRLDREEESGREVVDTDDAGDPLVIARVSCVAVDDTDDKPHAGEQQPAGDER